jgi:hypothetical protein
MQTKINLILARPDDIVILKCGLQKVVDFIVQKNNYFSIILKGEDSTRTYYSFGRELTYVDREPNHSIVDIIRNNNSIFNPENN